VLYNTPGTYDVLLIVANADGSDTILTPGYIFVNPAPVPPLLVLFDDSLTTPSLAASYQWFLDGVPISGAIAQFYIATLEGDYQLEITNTFGCTALSDTLTYNFGTVAQYSVSNSVICAGDTAYFTDLSSGNPTSWFWIFTGGSPATSLTADNAIVYNDTGSFDVMLMVSNSGGSDTLLMNDYISVFPSPLVPGIILFGGALATPAIAGSYQWYLDGVLISGADETSYTPSTAGIYTVLYTDNNGCSEFSEPFLYGIIGVSEHHDEIWLALYIQLLLRVHDDASCIHLHCLRGYRFILYHQEFQIPRKSERFNLHRRQKAV